MNLDSKCKQQLDIQRYINSEMSTTSLWPNRKDLYNEDMLLLVEESKLLSKTNDDWSLDEVLQWKKDECLEQVLWWRYPSWAACVNLLRIQCLVHEVSQCVRWQRLSERQQSSWSLFVHTIWLSCQCKETSISKDPLWTAKPVWKDTWTEVWTWRPWH